MLAPFCKARTSAYSTRLPPKPALPTDASSGARPCAGRAVINHGKTKEDDQVTSDPGSSARGEDRDRFVEFEQDVGDRGEGGLVDGCGVVGLEQGRDADHP